jgi:hypothetical protein
MVASVYVHGDSLLLSAIYVWDIYWLLSGS